MVWETEKPRSLTRSRSSRIKVDFPAPEGAETTKAMPRVGARAYSHSIVAGGFDEMSYTTRLTPRTSLMIRFEIRPSSS